MKFPDLLERFQRYVKVDTQSSEESDTLPSTEKQFNLAKILKSELEELGLSDVVLTDNCYVMGTLKSNQKKKLPVIAFIAHMDTSPDVSGKDVRPILHKNYQCNDIVISKENNIVLRVDEHPLLKEQEGKTIITSDGSTLLGADNKAGIAEIFSAVNYLINNPEIPRPDIRVIVTPDEEVGRGTEGITKEDVAADFAYTIDGERLGELEDETFCADTVVVNIEGVSVHPGYAKDKLVNAIKVASAIIEKLPPDSCSPETTEGREGYIHPHQVTGGTEKAQIKLLIRDFEEQGLKEKEDLIREICKNTEDKFPKADIKIEVIESYRNMKVVIDKYPQVTEFAVNAMKMSCVRPVKNIIRGGTDGARLSFMGIPCPNIFTGGSSFHSRFEWAVLEDMHKASEVIVNLAKIWAEKK